LIPSLRDVYVVKSDSGSFPANRLSYSKPEDLASYLGIPSIQFSDSIETSTKQLLPDINVLPFRAYAKI